jgi:hypothetical protein
LLIWVAVVLNTTREGSIHHLVLVSQFLDVLPLGKSRRSLGTAGVEIRAEFVDDVVNAVRGGLGSEFVAVDVDVTEQEQAV